MAPESASVLTLAPTPAPANSIRPTASPPNNSFAKQSPPSTVRSPPATVPARSPQHQAQLAGPSHSTASENHREPSPPPKLPEVVPSTSASSVPSPPSKALSPKNSFTAASQIQAPAQLALLLSSTLNEVDVLRRELAEEKKRSTRVERILTTLQASSDSQDTKRDELPESAVKAILEAEARAERAERARDDALHALSSLSSHFAELDRYESTCSMRAADARNAFTRLLSAIISNSQTSPTPSNASPSFSFSLPPIPAPFPPFPQSASIPGPLPPIASAHTRYSRAHPPQQPPQQQISYGGSYTPQSAYPPNPIPTSNNGNGHVRQNSSSAAFSALPLPPPPTAAGLGTTATIMNHPTVPAKRVHRSRSTRAEDEMVWDESKRRRVGSWGMDVDEIGVPLSAVQQESTSFGQLSHQQTQQAPLSAHPTHIQPRIYERERGPQTPSYPYPPMASVSMSSRSRGESERDREPMNGLGRVDARELVRDAKERERRGRSYARPSNSINHAYSVEPPIQGQQQIYNRTSEARRGRRSVSRDSQGSEDIEELLLETATDRERERNRDRGRPSPNEGVGPHREPPILGQYQTHVFTPPVTAGIPTSGVSNSSGVPPNDAVYAGPPNAGSGTGPKRTSSAINGMNGLGYNGVGGSVNGAPVNGSGANGNGMVNGNANNAGNGLTPAAGGGGKVGSSTVPATQLVTLGPGGVVVSGGGTTSSSASVIPGGGFPPQNTAGQRICRQCGVPGRYKDGKCVEKWGPGPEGPGTVCDRCRKKMKRVERRGTLDSAAANAHLLAHRQNQLHATASLPIASSAAAHHNQSRSRVAPRTETLILDQQHGHDQSQSQGYRQLSQTQTQILSPNHRPSSYSRERDARSSGSHSPIGNPLGHSASAPNIPITSTSRHPVHPQSQYSHNGQSQGSSQRRPPTPPYINSISTHEQYDELEGDRDELDDEHDHRRRLRGSDGDGEDLDIEAELERAVGGSTPEQLRKAAPASTYNNGGSKKYPNSAYSEGKPRVAPNGTVYPPMTANNHHYKPRGTNSNGKRTPVNTQVGENGIVDRGEATYNPLNLITGSTASKYPHSHARRRDDAQHDELADDHELERDQDIPRSAAAQYARSLGHQQQHFGRPVQNHGHNGGDYDMDADVDADGSGSGDADADADPDADIMDAVDATMKVED